MLNLDLLISYNRESLTDKPPESITENIYQIMFDASDRFLCNIKLEYQNIFEFIKISPEQRASLDNIITKLKMFMFNVAASLPRRSYAKKHDIFDSLIIDEEDDQFTRFSLKNVLSLTYELDLHNKEYRKSCLNYERDFIKRPTIEKLGNSSFIDSLIDHKDKTSMHKKNFTSLARNKNNREWLENKKVNEISNATKKRSKSFDSQISEHDGESLLNLQFCESLIDSYNQLVQQFNYNCVKQFEQNGYKDIVQAVESYLDDLCEDELFMYIKSRVIITRVVVKLMEELKIKSFNAYTDKLLKPSNDSMPIRKGSTYSDLKNYSRVDTNKLSLYLSRIRSMPFSNDNFSLMEEIQIVLKDKKRVSDLNIEEIDETDNHKQRKSKEEIVGNYHEKDFCKKMDKLEEFQSNVYRCYCSIF